MSIYKPSSFTQSRAAFQLACGRYIFGTYYSFVHRLRIYGRENVPESGPFIAVANHQSYLDPPLLVVATDTPMGYIAKAEVFEVPFVGWVTRTLNGIPVNRDKPEKSTFKAVKEIVSKGWPLGMFIEGTRSQTPGKMGQPYTGPAYFAYTNKIPLVPIGIIGTDQPFAPITINIGKPIQPSRDLEATTWQVMEALSKLSGRELPERQPATAEETAT